MTISYAVFSLFWQDLWFCEDINMIYLQSSPFHVRSMVILAQPLFVGILQGMRLQVLLRMHVVWEPQPHMHKSYVFMSGFPRLYGVVSFPDYTLLQNMVWEQGNYSTCGGFRAANCAESF